MKRSIDFFFEFIIILAIPVFIVMGCNAGNENESDGDHDHDAVERFDEDVEVEDWEGIQNDGDEEVDSEPDDDPGEQETDETELESGLESEHEQESPSVDPWAGCPGSEDYIGDEWTLQLEVTDKAVYCGTFNEARTLKQELKAKVQLALASGFYALPSENGEYDFRLPFCARFAADVSPVPMGAAGKIRTNHDANRYRFSIEQPLKVDGLDWTFEMDINLPVTRSKVLTLDGRYNLPEESILLTSRLCMINCDVWIDNRMMNSCVFDNVPEGEHHLTFDRGNLELALRIGFSMAGTEPGLFHHGAGELDGLSFEQLDYWKLIYNPEHHHFSRHFIVLFKQAINDVCGIKVEDLSPWNDPEQQNGRAATLDCDLEEIETLEITGHYWLKK